MRRLPRDLDTDYFGAIIFALCGGMLLGSGNYAWAVIELTLCAGFAVHSSGRPFR